ncbi:MAG TPA: hypothetical protein VKD72_13965 [Gemmataceae bacterium]|nr:hypothetical protein [Gemmataceae bacterium]
MRPNDFVPWEGELLMGFPTGPDGPAPPPKPAEPRAPSDLGGWDSPWIDLGGEG